MKKILTIWVIIFCTAVSAWGDPLVDNNLKAAKQGNAEAQFNLGVMYAHSKGVTQDYKQAVYWYTKAAEQGNSSAQFHLGVMYAAGKGVTKDYKQAVDWYLKAAKQGNAEAQFILGLTYSNGYGKGVLHDHKQAVYWYTKSAEQGYASAQFNLGVMYANGKGVTQDYKKAFAWYKKAAEQGVADAQYSLGFAFANGKGVTQDYKQAVDWYKKAAEQGAAVAQFNLGVMYDAGKGVTKDYKQAFEWYKKAAEQGVGDAQCNLGVMYSKGEGVSQNYVLGYVWSSLAAAQGEERAVKNRDMVARHLSSQQLIQAQELAAEIQNKINNPSKQQDFKPSIAESEKKIAGSGTGFILTRNGYVLTCHHVIKDSKSIKIVVGETQYAAKLIRDDPHNDLALLKIDGTFPAIAFSSQRSAIMGQEVFTIGFPNPALQGVSAKFSKGVINSLSGFQDDLRLYQISIPVQPGNSGGALLDNDGNILGVIVAMLDPKMTFKVSGSLPQNVNYAIKGVYAQALLDTVPEVADKLISPSKSKINAVARVKESTVMVLSY